MAIRINCGGPTVREWESDAAYLVPGHEGASHTFGGTHDLTAVTDPAPHEVYQTVRHENHQYSFADVPNGQYLVRIHFTDAHVSDRAMDYTIEQEKVLTGFNITDVAGGTNKAVIREFNVQVADGNGLQIVCESGSGNDVFEAGIEILSGGEGPAVVAVTAPSAGDTVSVGETLHITWICTKEVGMNVRLTVDEGENWILLNTEKASPTTGGAGSYDWTVQATMDQISTISNSAVIKVSDYWDEAVYAESEPFVIAPSASVTVTTGARLSRASSVRATAGRLHIMVIEPGPHRVAVVDPAGRCVKRFAGVGARNYAWEHGPAHGLYFVRITAA